MKAYKAILYFDHLSFEFTSLKIHANRGSIDFGLKTHTSLNSLAGAAMAFSSSKYEAQHHAFFPLEGTAVKKYEVLKILWQNY